MWRGLTQLVSQLTVVSELLREQNSLLREQIRLSSGRPAQTPVTKYSHVLHQRPQDLPPPKTEADVWYPGKPEPGRKAATAHTPASPGAHPGSSETTAENS